MTDVKADAKALLDGYSFLHRTARLWNKIVIRLDQPMSEAAAAYLADLSGSGIEISSSEGDRPNDGTGRTIQEKIIAYIPVDLEDSARKTDTLTGDLKHFLDTLVHIFPDCSPPEFSTEIIKEEDWGKAWKSFFSSFQVTPKLTIKPSWENAGAQPQRPGEDAFVIEMDPGLAFGTGHHASTALALLILEQLYHDNKSTLKDALDVGTGSGILAMGCGLFGAQKVLAIDNDPDAVETARKNVARNSLEHIITVSGQDIASIRPDYNLIVANITHDALAEMAEEIILLLAPAGYLVLSGILKGGQEKSICDIFTGHGLHLIKSRAKEEWAALLFNKSK